MVQSQQGHRPPLRSVLEAYTNVTVAAFTAKAGDRLIGVNRAGTVTITLPTAELRSGRTYTVKDESGAAATNNITIATEGSENIDGAATDTIAENYGSKTYYSDGSNWFTMPLLASPSHTLDSHSSGTLQHEKGGLEADVNAGDGFVQIKAGSTTIIKTNIAGTTAPGVSDDSAGGYGIGSIWLDATNDRAYVCLDASVGAAVWREAPALATIAQTDTGTDTGKAVTPDGLAGSVHGEKIIQMVVFDFATDVATGDGKFYFHVPSTLNGFNVVEVHAEVIIAGTTNTTDIQLHNLTQTADILSTIITIDSGETGSDTAAAPAVINAAEDDLQTNDVIRVDVDAASTTAPKGLIVTLVCRLP